MKNGHRGGNHPVKQIKTGRIEITSQNHGFVISEQTLPESATITHRSLFDGSIEGFEIAEKNIFLYNITQRHRLVQLRATTSSASSWK